MQQLKPQTVHLMRGIRDDINELVDIAMNFVRSTDFRRFLGDFNDLMRDLLNAWLEGGKELAEEAQAKLPEKTEAQKRTEESMTEESKLHAEKLKESVKAEGKKAKETVAEKMEKKTREAV